MSEQEITQARLEVERSVADFEIAMDALLEHVERGADRVASLTDRTKDFSSRLREFVDIDQAVGQIQDSMGEVIDFSAARAREAAEKELAKMDTRPLVTWGAVLFSGFLLGYILARKT